MSRTATLPIDALRYHGGGPARDYAVAPMLPWDAVAKVYTQLHPDDPISPSSARTHHSDALRKIRAAWVNSAAPGMEAVR